jgi:NitT/TauT family transport system substrate-binding protein
MKKTRLFLLGFLFIVLAVLLSYQLLINDTTTPEPPLKIGLNIWAGYAHAFVAEQKGFFDQHEVKVELIFKPEISDIFKLYKKGELDGMFNVFTDILMLNAEGFPTRVVYIADYSDSGDVIIGRPEFNSLPDLKGKTISFEGVDTFSHMLVLSLLEQAGIQPGEFQAVNLFVHDVLDALEAGKIDAGHTWEPTTSQALEKGYKILGKAGDIPGIITDVLAFRADVIKQRPDDIRGVVQALLKAREFLEAQPEEAITIMAKANQMSKAEMELGMKGIYYPNLLENRAAMQSGGALFKSGQIAADFFLRSGQLFEKPDFETLIDARFVQ